MSNYVDLQAVSIDPLRPEIKKGSQTIVVANLKNNGPGIIPAGEAKVHVTVNKACANKPTGFKSIGPDWKLEAIQSKDNYELFAVNKGPIEVNEAGFPGFKFTVKGKKAGVIDITLASTLSATAGSSDLDGANQSVSTQIIVK